MRRWSCGLCLVAGLMGASGVALAALGAHRGGGEDVRIAADFLLIHAAAVLGLAALSVSAGRPLAWLLSGSVMAAGAVMFSMDLALIGLASLRPLPIAAPIGGVCLILGWLLSVAAAVAGMLRNN